MFRSILKHGLGLVAVVLVLGSLLGLTIIQPTVPETEITDADGDTKWQTEETVDEDILRADVAGGEKLTISSTSLDVAVDIFVADSKGLVVGHTAKILASNTSEFQVLGTSGADASQVFARFSANNKAPQFNFLKSRSGTIGLHGIVLDNDVIGQFKFLPDDGVDFNTQAGLFYVEVDDPSPAAGDIGAAFVWELMPGGGGALRRVMQLFATGNLELLSTTGAFIPTLLTTTQRDALTEVNGMFFHNLTLSRSQLREAGAWNSIVTPGSTDTFTNKTFDANATGNSLSNVDVADHATGTDGEIPTWDSSGNPAVVAVGTSGQVLTSNGVGAAPTFQAAAGGAATKEFWVLPQSSTSATNSAGIRSININMVSQVFFNGIMPADFVTATAIEVFVLAADTNTYQWDSLISFAAPGEVSTVNDASALNETQAVTDTEIEALDVSAVWTGIAALDFFSYNFQSDFSSIRVIGLRFKY